MSSCTQPASYEGWVFRVKNNSDFRARCRAAISAITGVGGGTTRTESRYGLLEWWIFPAFEALMKHAREQYLPCFDVWK